MEGESMEASSRVVEALREERLQWKLELSPCIKHFVV